MCVFVLCVIVHDFICVTCISLCASQSLSVWEDEAVGVCLNVSLLLCVSVCLCVCE